MLYAVLIYNAETEVDELTRTELEALIARHERVQEKLAGEGKLGPVVRLMSTRSATTLKPAAGNRFTDGPFAETKEQLLGFYIVDCATLQEAQEAARLIGSACNSRSLEVRPVGLFYPGGDIEAVKIL